MTNKTIHTLLSFAQSFIGVTERGGDNRGPEVEKFQKAVDGKASREAWCMCFVQYCLEEVEKKLQKNHGVFPSEHCLTVWNGTHPSMKHSSPQPGDIVIWQYFKNGKATASGHTGIVLSVNDTKMVTVEGNTGPGLEVVREGDGVYKKVRSIKGSAKMKVVGFIRPFKGP